MARIPTTNREIIEAFGMRRFGEICGFDEFPIQRANDMRRRGSINSRYWDRIVVAAKELNLPVTLEVLQKAQPIRRRPRSRAGSKAAA